jgi:hypothetical protein
VPLRDRRLRVRDILQGAEHCCCELSVSSDRRGSEERATGGPDRGAKRALAGYKRQYFGKHFANAITVRLELLSQVRVLQ